MHLFNIFALQHSRSILCKNIINSGSVGEIANLKNFIREIQRINVVTNPPTIPVEDKKNIITGQFFLNRVETNKENLQNENTYDKEKIDLLTADFNRSSDELGKPCLPMVNHNRIAHTELAKDEIRSILLNEGFDNNDVISIVDTYYQQYLLGGSVANVTTALFPKTENSFPNWVMYGQDLFSLSGATSSINKNKDNKKITITFNKNGISLTRQAGGGYEGSFVTIPIKLEQEYTLRKSEDKEKGLEAGFELTEFSAKEFSLLNPLKEMIDEPLIFSCITTAGYDKNNTKGLNGEAKINSAVLDKIGNRVANILYNELHDNKITTEELKNLTIQEVISLHLTLRTLSYDACTRDDKKYKSMSKSLADSLEKLGLKISFDYEKPKDETQEEKKKNKHVYCLTM
jgi:hypothetical protein